MTRYLTEPVVGFLAKSPVTPGAVTWFGFLLTIIAAVLIALDFLLIAGVVVLVASYFDIIDGALARRTNRVTPFGGILDSTLDRLSDAALFVGILALYAGQQATLEVVLAGVTLVASFLVSYVRARAEAQGLDCHVGIFTRAERVVLLALGLLLDQIVIALGIMAVLSFFTVGQRLLHARRQTVKG